MGALQLTVDDHPKPKSASFGVRCLMTVLRWAAAAGRRYVARDLLDLKASAAKPRRDRVLSRDELARVLPALRADVSPCAAGLKLILLTACRRGEASAARWRDVDLAAGTWTLPMTKNGTEHVIPLSRQAIDLLRSLRPIDADPAALVFASRAGKALDDWEGATERVQAASGTADWHRHDLRRTAATTMGMLGTIPDIVEAALNHATIHSPLAATYNKARYRPEVATALQLLADYYRWNRSRRCPSHRAAQGDGMRRSQARPDYAYPCHGPNRRNTKHRQQWRNCFTPCGGDLGATHGTAGSRPRDALT